MKAKIKKIIAQGSYSDLMGQRYSGAPTMKEGQPLAVKGGHIETLTIDDAFAEQLLNNRHANQRVARGRHVDALAKAMAAGKWHQTLDPIKLDKDLRLIDGQHRLLAVTKAKVPVSFLVAVLDDADAFYAIDQGAPRSINDVRATLGKEAVGSAVRGAILLESRGFGDRILMSKEELDALLDAFPLMGELEGLYRIGQKTRMGTVGPLAASVYCMRANRKAAFQFFSAVFSMDPSVDGERVQQAHALYTFLHAAREKAAIGRRSGESFIRESAYKSVRAWNAWRKNEPITKLQYDPGAKFPAAAK